MASAHLSPTDLAPVGGATLKIGDPFVITWTETVHHDLTDLALSVDDGATFTNFKTGFQDINGKNTFKWTVAGAESKKAKIRICQESGKPCTNADKVTDNSGNAGHYVLITSAFTITAGTSALQAVQHAEQPYSIGFNPGTRNVDVSLGLARAEDVSLQAFDFQGRLVATLTQGRFEAGEHKLSLFSNRLESSAKSLIFRLQLGNQVLTQAWTRAE
jgi:hypothetical protein